MRIAICDDEKDIREILAEKVNKYCPEAEIFCYASGQEVLTADRMPDILFLDIQMPGVSGMETAQGLRARSKELILIFVTALEEYVFQAFDVGAFHYLVKPVEDEKLKTVLRRAVKREQCACGDYIVVSRERQRRKIFLDSVWYFEIKGRQIDVHQEKGVFTYYEQIGLLEKQLEGKGFFRCHKSYLINLKHVEVYNRQEAILENGERIIIARRRYEAFCQAILASMKENGGIL